MSLAQSLLASAFLLLLAACSANKSVERRSVSPYVDVVKDASVVGKAAKRAVVTNERAIDVVSP